MGLALLFITHDLNLVRRFSHRVGVMERGRLVETGQTDAVFAENPDLPRLFLLEEEYRRAIVSAELGWVRSVVADLDAGRLTWTEEWLMGLFAEHDPMNPTQERTSHDARSQA